MAKIVLIGAGSHVFSKHLVTDILTYPELRDSTITLMDIAAEPLVLITDYARKIVAQNGFKTKIESTTNRQKALDGADYVLTTIKVGDWQPSAAKSVSEYYGVELGRGDTLGAGGVFYGARHVPAIMEICRDMEKLCPDAWLMNYTNPMAIITWAVNDYTLVKNVGLCHSVPHTATTLAKYLGIPAGELEYWVAGINHMAWFLELKWQGQDAYPRLRERFKTPEIYGAPDANYNGPDIVRAEIFKAFGYLSPNRAGTCRNMSLISRRARNQLQNSRRLTAVRARKHGCRKTRNFAHKLKITKKSRWSTAVNTARLLSTR
jgi:alpha-galactosidase